MSGAVTTLTCPHCGRVGKTAKAIPTGAKVTCKGCRQTFRHEPPEQELAPLPKHELLPPADNLDKPALLAPMAEPASSPPPRTQPTPIRTESPSDQQFNIQQKIGAWIAGGGLLVLGLSPFFRWINFGNGGVIGLSGDGKILFATTVIGAIAYLSAIIKRKWLTPVFLAVQAWGTLAVFWMGALLWKLGSILNSLDLLQKDNQFAGLFATQISPGAGLYLGLIGGIAVAGALGFVAVCHLLMAGNVKLFYVSQGLSCLFGILLVVFVAPDSPSKFTDIAIGSTPRYFGTRGRRNAGNKEGHASITPEEPKPTPAGQPLRRGDVEFDVHSAEITKVKKEGGYYYATFPEEPVLIVRFTVKNISINKRYFYKDYIEMLTDDLGNHYKYIESVPRGLKEFQGFEHKNGDAINPGEVMKCSAVFERPLTSAKNLEIEIFGGVIARSPHQYGGGSEPSYRFVISMDMVKQ